jgi:ADP-heptose:LPS heptosyltransferase
VGDALAGRGFRIILTGSQEEQHLTRLVASQMKYPPLDLAGITDLGSLAALLSGARLVICNDTGVSHLTDAVKVPSVVLFSASDPNRWAPLDQELHRIIRWASAAPSQVVLDEVEILLRKERAYVFG